MTNEENKKIQEMLTDKTQNKESVLKYIKEKCQQVIFTPKTLGMIFEMVADVHSDEDDLTTYFSREVKISELTAIHPGFESVNGCAWARSDISYLGQKYIIRRAHEKGKVSSVKLDGPNNSVKRYKTVRKDIVDEVKARKCSVLDVFSNIEIDHKNGKYNELTNIDTETQKLSEFQALSKPVNDAKRQHCKLCRATGLRYDARNLGYSCGWVAGDAKTESCVGCYWYDPLAFNKKMSERFEQK